MFTETKIRATKKVNQILENLKTVSDCGAASKVIDFYEKEFSNEKNFIKECRNFLCDRTFELYLNK
tara:strand:+ start:172 stop:369 length:198 start_codon:yes stop_codon:yes gene_type:complete